MVRGDLAQHVSKVITGAGLLDLDYLGAKVAKQHAQMISVQQYAELKNPHAFQQVEHR